MKLKTVLVLVTLSCFMWAAPVSAKMTIEEWDARYFVAKRKLEKLCRLSDRQDAKVDAIKAHIARETAEVKNLRSRLNHGVFTRAVGELGLPNDIALHIMRGRLPGSSDPGIAQLLADRQRAVDAIDAYEAGIPKITGVSNRLELKKKRRLNRKKSRAERIVLKLERTKPIGDPIIDEENEREIAELEAELEEIARELDALGVSDYVPPAESQSLIVARAFVRALAATAAEIVRESSFVFDTTPQATPTTGSSVTVGEKSKFRFNFSVGLSDPSKLTFNDFNQRPITQQPFNFGFSADYAILWRLSPTWETYVALNFLHFNEKYQNHRNLPGGAIGPSSGSTNYTFLGAALKFETLVSDRFGLGVSPGIGALNVNTGGSFNANGTRPAISGELYGFYKLTDNFDIVPGIRIIVPLGDYDGGAGAATSSVSVGSIKSVFVGARLKF